MSDDKDKAIQTSKSLKETVQDSGLLCITVSCMDYVQIGQSIFIGLRKTNHGQAGISIVAPKDHKITRFLYRPGV